MNRTTLAIAIACITAILGISGFVALILEQRAAHRQEQRPAPPPTPSAPVDPEKMVIWDGRVFRQGDRVRIMKWAGTIKPEETGHSAEIHAKSGHTGVVLRGERRVETFYRPGDAEEPIQIVRVRWDPQEWKEFGRDRSVKLGAFESTIHVSYLEVFGSIH